MERAVEAGKVKSISLSNFYQTKFQKVLDIANFFTMSEEQQEAQFANYAPDFNNQR